MSATTSYVVSPSERRFRILKNCRRDGDTLQRIPTLVHALGCHPTVECKTVTVQDYDDLTIEQLTIVRHLMRSGFAPIYYETPKS